MQTIEQAAKDYANDKWKGFPRYVDGYKKEEAIRNAEESFRDGAKYMREKAIKAACKYIDTKHCIGNQEWPFNCNKFECDELKDFREYIDNHQS